MTTQPPYPPPYLQHQYRRAASDDAPTALTGDLHAAPATTSRHFAVGRSIYPVPKSITRGLSVPLRGKVHLIAAPNTDTAALAALRAVLADAGSEVRTLPPGATPSSNGSFIYLGSQDDNPAIATVLSTIGVDAGTALCHSEGYVLATGRDGDRRIAVLAGHDANGTFYAVQTMRQMVGRGSVRPVTVHDWPDFPVRGVIEGFYGTPWSHAARLAQLDFYGAHKMNRYVYCPKDDPYLRSQWREPYPTDNLVQLNELVERAAANHVEFTYALSPGPSICYSSKTEAQSLVEKFSSLWRIGVRTFAIPLDDISYTTWNCDADEAAFGTGAAAAGKAQAYLINQIQRDFIETHPGVSRLEMVPTEYSDTSDSPYKSAIKADLNPAVLAQWTGVGVIAPTITAAQAAAAERVFARDILLWDNYPVNDYVAGRLLLGPYVGREADLAGELYGVTANPMIQPEASKIALFTVADYTWNTAAYHSATSWQAGLAELAGSDRTAGAALAAFADLNYTSALDSTQAPTLAAELARFWTVWERGDSHAAHDLDTYLAVISDIPATLTARMGNPAFVADTRPWLDSAGSWGAAARTALRMLVEQRHGNRAAALRDREQAELLATEAKSMRYQGLGAEVTVVVGDGVIDTFVTKALAENDHWLGGTSAATGSSPAAGAFEHADAPYPAPRAPGQRRRAAGQSACATGPPES